MVILEVHAHLVLYCRSEVIWEMTKNRKRWKPVEIMVGIALEKMYQEKKRGIHDIPDTEWIVDFSDPDQVGKAESYMSQLILIFLLQLSLIQKDGERKMLRRSHFDGLYTRAAWSKSLTTVELKISKVQVSIASLCSDISILLNMVTDRQ